MAARELGEEPKDVTAAKVLGDIAGMAWAIQSIDPVGEITSISRTGSRLVEPGFGFERIDCYQRQAQITHFDDQAVQRGLIGDEPRENGVAAVEMAYRHAIEPLRPCTVEVLSDSDGVVHVVCSLRAPATTLDSCLRLDDVRA